MSHGGMCLKYVWLWCVSSKGVQFFNQVLYGGVLVLLVNVMLPGTPEENLRRVWIHILRLYDELGIKNRFGNIKLTMFTTTGKLKGTAAEVRHLGHVLAVLWKHYWNSEKDLDKQIELCLRLSSHMERILDLHPEEFVLPGAVFRRSVSL